jgi:hypothetical protein
MRQYLYVYLGLVLAGMIILTAACPEFRLAVTMQYPKNCRYYVYNSNGDRLFTAGRPSEKSIIYAGRASAEQKF